MDYLLKSYMDTGLLEYMELWGSEEDHQLRQYFAECARLDNCRQNYPPPGLDREACD
ncbi:MAG: hypothetical protein FWH00_04980 [Oscillospiraceae bacterium]|nr:hypothetical protein [Oscillospiraceae bacterium]